MLEVSATQGWRSDHPGATIGLLELTRVDNGCGAEKLRDLKRQVERRLRETYAGFTRQDFFSLRIMDAYRGYYKRFKKSYHVQLQVESIVLKGRSLPDVSPLVDVNFIAEIESFVLTAGHDVGKLCGQVLIDASRAGDHITQMNGESKAIRPGDMIMRDEDGISCSIIYGQDNRSPITGETNHVLYVSYAPPGVPEEAVENHFQKIEGTVRLFSPEVVIEQRRLLHA